METKVIPAPRECGVNVLVEAIVSHKDWSNNSILVDVGDTRNIEVKRDAVHDIVKLKIKEESIARLDGVINKQTNRIIELQAELADAKAQPQLKQAIDIIHSLTSPSSYAINKEEDIEPAYRELLMSHSPIRHAWATAMENDLGAQDTLKYIIIALTNWIEQVIEERIQAILRDPNAVALFPPIDTK